MKTIVIIKGRAFKMNVTSKTMQDRILSNFVFGLKISDSFEVKYSFEENFYEFLPKLKLPSRWNKERYLKEKALHCL